MAESTEGKSKRIIEQEFLRLLAQSRSADLVEEIAPRLREAGRKAARRALLLQGSDDERVEAAFLAGLALEYTAKAFVASVHPVLMVDGRDFDSLLVATGHAHFTSAGLNNVRTITGSEACLRASRLTGGRWKFTKADDSVFHARNAAAHFAFHDDDGIDQVLRAMVRLVDDLRQLKVEIPETRAEFWGDATPIVNAILTDEASKLETRLQAKVIAARRKLDERLVGLDDAQRRAVLELVSGLPDGDADYEEERECPACHQWGWLRCIIEFGGSLPQDEDDEEPEWWEVFAYPVEFACSACGLTLDVREVEQAGFPEVIQLEDRQR